MTKEPHCQTKFIKNLVRDYIPNSTTISNVSGELAMSLPTDNEQVLSNLLKKLSVDKDNLGINNFGLSVTTLEDVFLKVGAADTEENMEFDRDEDNDDMPKANGDGMARHQLQRKASVESADYAEVFLVQ